MQEGPGTEGRVARIVWVLDGQYLLVSGFNRQVIKYNMSLHLEDLKELLFRKHIEMHLDFLSSQEISIRLYTFQNVDISSEVMDHL